MSERNSNMEAMAMKMLRLERKEAIGRARERIREQNAVIRAIRKALAGGGMTVPELAEAVELDTRTTLVYISTLKKYGMVGEGAKEGDYFRYELSE